MCDCHDNQSVGVCFDVIMFTADVVIRERLRDMQKVENETVKFICKVKNPKNYPITWMKNKKPITADNK